MISTEGAQALVAMQQPTTRLTMDLGSMVVGSRTRRELRCWASMHTNSSVDQNGRPSFWGRFHEHTTQKALFYCNVWKLPQVVSMVSMEVYPSALWTWLKLCFGSWSHHTLVQEPHYSALKNRCFIVNNQRSAYAYMHHCTGEAPVPLTARLIAGGHYQVLIRNNPSGVTSANKQIGWLI